MIHQALQMALRSTKADHNDVLSCSVAASGQTLDLILLDVEPEDEKKKFFHLLSPQRRT